MPGSSGLHYLLFLQPKPIHLKRTILFLSILFFLSDVPSYAQSKRQPFADTLKSVTIDSVLVITAKRGLDITDFISVMLADTGFYQAFKNMKRFSFVAENSIRIFNDNQTIRGKIFRKIYHNNTGPKYKQEILSSADSGKVYKRNGDFDLYTVRMFSYIFMNESNTDYTDATDPATGSVTTKGEEGYKQKLKTLIFTPGRPVKGIPLISSKTEIFGADLRKYYDYSFYYATYQGSIPVFYFKCKVKPGISWWKEGDTMIKELTTIFDAKNMNILARYVDMNYSSVPFDFDVKMNIELSYLDEETLVPTHISYDGYWDIPFKKKEICTFDIHHYQFRK